MDVAREPVVFVWGNSLHDLNEITVDISLARTITSPRAGTIVSSKDETSASPHTKHCLQKNIEDALLIVRMSLQTSGSNAVGSMHSKNSMVFLVTTIRVGPEKERCTSRSETCKNCPSAEQRVDRHVFNFLSPAINSGDDITQTFYSSCTCLTFIALGLLWLTCGTFLLIWITHCL